MNKKIHLIIGIVLLILISIGSLVLFLTKYNNDQKEEQEDTPPLPLKDSTILKYGFPISDFRQITDEVKSGETLSQIFSRHNVSGQITHNISAKAKDVFNVASFRAGNEYTLLFCSDDSTAAPDYFIYEKNLAEYVVFDLTDTLHVYSGNKDIVTKQTIYSNSITSSLWNSMTENGQSPLLALKLADVYQWTIDFFGIQQGDRYQILYEDNFVEGKSLNDIRPLASSFTHMDSTYYAYWFEQDSIKGYFDENGASLHKAFLKAPLKYSRISSRFSGRRFHPVHKKYRPHTGVDYAAPSGTPVYAVGDGTVIKKTYQRGGAGKYVSIKHNKTYTTLYMHFSRHVKNLKVGQRVSQGDLIGYVGSTGSSTGPHLHYTIKKNGTPIDPLKMESPPAKPLEGKILADFLRERDRLNLLLTGENTTNIPEDTHPIDSLSE